MIGTVRCHLAGPASGFFRHACRLEDVEQHARSGAAHPFSAVNLIGGGRVRPGQRRIKVATAAYLAPREGDGAHRSLNVYTVPAGLARSVRTLLRGDGLRRLAAWLDECERRSAFWQAHDHWADLHFDTASGSLTFRERR